MSFMTRPPFEIAVIKINRNLVTELPVAQVFFLLEGGMEVLHEDQRLMLQTSDVLVIPPFKSCRLTPMEKSQALSLKVSPELPASEFLRHTPLLVFPATQGAQDYGQLRKCSPKLPVIVSARKGTKSWGSIR